MIRTFAPLLIALAAVLAIPASAQNREPGNPVSFFGDDQNNRFGVKLTISGTPRLGGRYSLGWRYRQTSVCQPAITHWRVYLVTGLSNESWNGIPLPLRLKNNSTAALSLLVSPNLIAMQAFRATDTCPPNRWPNLTAPVTFGFALPNQPSLIGTVYYQQILAIHTAFWSVSTDGLRVEIVR